MMEEGLCPEISVLSSLLDGELVGEENEIIKSHVKSCPACVERLEYMAAGHQVLVKSLGKSIVLGDHSKKKDCISAETMAAYFHDLLPVEEKTRVESHLDLCDACLSELTLLAKTEMQMRQSDMEPLPDSLRKRVEALWREEEGKKEEIPHIVTRLVAEYIEFMRDLLPRPSLALGGALAAVMAGLLLFIWWGPFRVIKEPSGSPTPSSTTGPVEKARPLVPGSTERDTQIALAPPPPAMESKPSAEPGSEPDLTPGPMVASRPGDKIEEGKASIPAGRQEPLGGTKPGGPITKSPLGGLVGLGQRGISQDFRDVRVEVGPLQVMGGEAILSLKIFNKTAGKLGIVLAESPPLLADRSGVTHGPKTLTGIKPGPYAGQNWTYIAPNGEHTISLTFDERNLSVRRDSVYSISVGIILARRDDAERAKAGSRPARAETLNISFQGITTQ